LLAALQDAHDRNLLDADALSMMEGVLQVSELRALDLMVPRSQMDRDRPHRAAQSPGCLR